MGLNVAALYAVSAVLAFAYFLEFTRFELPCPLCLLQRIAFCAMAAGLVFNLKFGLRPRHYGLILLAASAGLVFSVRQILLHISPGDPGYGSTVLGLHYYTWGAVIFSVAILATAITLLFDRQFRSRATPWLGPIADGAIGLAFALTVGNVATTFIECGIGVCPDDPVRFEMLDAS